MTSTNDGEGREQRAAAGPSRRRTGFAVAWTALGLAAAVWLHAPARVLDAASGVGAGGLRVAGLRSALAAGPRAAPVADALETPDFVLRLNPQYSPLPTRGAVTLRLQTIPILGFSGQAQLRASLDAPSAQDAGRVTVRLPQALRLGATIHVTVTARGAAPGRYALTLTASSGGVTHVCSAVVSVR
jgi:hypothetical protein